MTAPYHPLGWDLEIAGEFPTKEEDRQWLTIEPSLGITCAAVFASPSSWIRWSSGSQETRLSQNDARNMADYLDAIQRAGGLIVTWNGLGFDFPVLARECANPAYTARLAEVALNHCDLGFAMHCSHGYMVGLNTAAKAFGLAGKLEGLSGSLAPILWNQPARELTDKERLAIHKLEVEPGTTEARDLCIRYVTQDAVTTLDVYNALLKEGALVWRTKSGSITKQPWQPYLKDGHIATCLQALEIPPPNTSWMRRAPRSRKDYAGWAFELCPDA